MSGATHRCYLHRLYLNKQSLETSAHVNLPPFLKSIYLLLIWRFIAVGECNESVYLKYKVFTEKKSSEEGSKHALLKLFKL